MYFYNQIHQPLQDLDARITLCAGVQRTLMNRVILLNLMIKDKKIKRDFMH